MRSRNHNEIRAKAYSLDPELLQAFKAEILSRYNQSSVSRVLGPDHEGCYWVFVNVYPDNIGGVS